MPRLARVGAARRRSSSSSGSIAFGVWDSIRVSGDAEICLPRGPRDDCHAAVPCVHPRLRESHASVRIRLSSMENRGSSTNQFTKVWATLRLLQLGFPVDRPSPRWNLASNALCTRSHVSHSVIPPRTKKPIPNLSRMQMEKSNSAPSG